MKAVVFRANRFTKKVSHIRLGEWRMIEGNTVDMLLLAADRFADGSPYRLEVYNNDIDTCGLCPSQIIEVGCVEYDNISAWPDSTAPIMRQCCRHCSCGSAKG